MFAIVSPTMLFVTDSNQARGRILYLGACLISAVRLAREERWDNSPRVVSRIAAAIQLAKRIYERMKAYFEADSWSWKESSTDDLRLPSKPRAGTAIA